MSREQCEGVTVALVAVVVDAVVAVVVVTSLCHFGAALFFFRCVDQLEARTVVVPRNVL